MKKSKAKLQQLLYALATLTFVGCNSAFAKTCELAWDISAYPIYSISEITEYDFKDKSGRKVFSITKSQLSAIISAHQSVYDAATQVNIDDGKKLEKRPGLFLCADSKPNAFATVSGDRYWVGITHGMVKLIGTDEAAAAAILGHEMGHLIHGHRDVKNGIRLLNLLGNIAGTAAQMALGVGGVNIGGLLGGAAGTAVATRFSRAQEDEADETGIKLLLKAGYSPEGFATVASKLEGQEQQLELLSTHPSWATRSEKIKNFLAKSKAEPNDASSRYDPGAGDAIHTGNVADVSTDPTGRRPQNPDRIKVCLKQGVGRPGEVVEVATAVSAEILSLIESKSCRGEKPLLGDIYFWRTKDEWISPPKLHRYRDVRLSSLAYFNGEIGSYESLTNPLIRVHIKQIFFPDSAQEVDLASVRAVIVTQIKDRPGASGGGITKEAYDFYKNRSILKTEFFVEAGSSRAIFHLTILKLKSSVVVVMGSSTEADGEYLAREVEAFVNTVQW